MIKPTDETYEPTKPTALSLEAALAAAVARELSARQAGLEELQAAAMDEIRQLRMLLQEARRVAPA